MDFWLILRADNTVACSPYKPEDESMAIDVCACLNANPSLLLHQPYRLARFVEVRS